MGRVTAAASVCLSLLLAARISEGLAPPRRALLHRHSPHLRSAALRGQQPRCTRLTALGSAAEASAGVESDKPGLPALFKFLRPHTVRGTILASVTGVARAITEQPEGLAALWQWELLPRAVLGMVALIFGNVYIVGINQIYDVDIDKVNKPFLPIAAGEMSKRAAWATVLFCGSVGSLIVSRLFSPIIFQLYMFGLVIGTLYSVPPFQFKRIPVMAGITIACVRGFLLNFGVYYAVKEALGVPFQWNPSVTFLARFMTAFAAVIAVTKDLPDIEGDRKFNVETFAARIGVKRISQWAVAALLLNYASAIATGIMAPAGVFNRPVMLGGHAALATLLVVRFRQLKSDSLASVKQFYRSIWDLFYLEYAMYPFI